MMAQERVNIFEDANDIDLSGFEPATDRKRKLKPPKEQVKAVSEAAHFPSREPPAPEAGSVKRKPHWHRTGRTAPLACRVMPETLDKIYDTAEKQGWKIGETVERAMDALERELKKQKGQGT
jgi:hypothetical protein